MEHPALMVAPPPASDPSILARVLSVERLLFASPVVCIGEFRCPPQHAVFDGGSCAGHKIVFPRTVVWIQHEGTRRFVADPTVITFYNRDQPYRRFRFAEADRCDWLAFPEQLAREIVETVAGPNDAAGGPFRVGRALSEPRLYLQQRRLFRRLNSPQTIPPLEIEETALDLLDAAVRRAHRQPMTAGARSASRDLNDRIEHVKGLIAARLDESPSLIDLAAAVDLSPHHLCRCFHTITGLTLRVYRTRLRVLAALEPMAAGINLTTVAQDLGFCSHSHFTYAFRRTFSATPSSVRDGTVA